MGGRACCGFGHLPLLHEAGALLMLLRAPGMLHSVAGQRHYSNERIKLLQGPCQQLLLLPLSTPPASLAFTTAAAAFLLLLLLLLLLFKSVT
jgi:hypothetical protein